MQRVRSPMHQVAAFCGTAVALTLGGCSTHAGDEHVGQEPGSEAIAAIDYDALFVVSGGDSSISVIDTSTNRLAATIRLQDAAFPHHLYLSADASWMALAVPGTDLSMGHGAGHHTGTTSGAVLLLDAWTGATSRARTLASMNHNAIFSPDGQEVWTSQATDGSVLVLDADTLETRNTIEVGQNPAEVTFSADGRRAFVANGGSASVSVIDVDNKAVLETIEVGDTPVGAWQGANGVAYVDNEGSRSLTAIDTVTLDVLATYDLGFTPGMAALGPDEAVWVTDADDGKVVTYSALEPAKLGEIATGAGAHAIAFNADGGFAYVSNQAEDTVSVIDLLSASVVATVSVGSRPNGLAWRAR